MLTTPILDCRGRSLVLDRPLLCGIVNVTPDSFSDGGSYVDPASAVAQGLKLVEEGADLLDIGGESTRPGSSPVSVEEEIARVIPVIEQLAARVTVPISVDTSKPDVMRAAVAAGARMINDIYALRQPGALETAAELGVPICLMHMQGEPSNMQQNPHYHDVVGEVHRFLAERMFACQMAGINKKHLLVDPGFGFGKTLQHNLALLRELERFKTLDCVVLVGLSRKSMIAELAGSACLDRLHGSVAGALLAVQKGAMILRVHDVAATRAALAVWAAVNKSDGTLRSSSHVSAHKSFAGDEDD